MEIKWHLWLAIGFLLGVVYQNICDFIIIKWRREGIMKLWPSAVRGFLVGTNLAMIYVLLCCPFVIENHSLWYRGMGVAFYVMFTLWLSADEVEESKNASK